MKNLFGICLLAFPLLLSAQNAKIKIDVTRVIGALVSGSDKLTDQFTFDGYANYQPTTKEVNVKSDRFTNMFPLHSFTQIKVSVKNQ